MKKEKEEEDKPEVGGGEKAARMELLFVPRSSSSLCRGDWDLDRGGEEEEERGGRGEAGRNNNERKWEEEKRFDEKLGEEVAGEGGRDCVIIAGSGRTGEEKRGLPPSLEHSIRGN